MYAVLFLIKILNFFSFKKNSNSRAIIKSVYLRARITNNDVDNTRDPSLALKMIYRINLYLFKFFRKLKKSPTMDKHHVAFSFGNPPEMISSFIAKYTDEKEENIFVMDKNIIYANSGYYYYDRISIHTLISIFKLYLFFQLAWFFSMFKKKKTNVGWMINVFELALQAILLSKQKRKFYFFFSLYESSYLLCYILSSFFKEECIMISSNSPMFRPMRYSYLPDANLKLCSVFQYEEYTFFSKNDWMKYKSIELWGPEESKYYDNIDDKQVKYDVAIYSSAEWARNEFYWRERDIEKIRRHELTSTFIYKIFDEMVLDTVLDLKRRMNLQVVFFPHPFERQLASNYQIFPPYMEKLKNMGVEFVNDGENSIKTIYQSKVAVAECSTIIMDRWNLGLDAYVFSGAGYEKKFKTDFDYRYLGKYQQYCYNDKADLREKLEACLVKYMKN